MESPVLSTSLPQVIQRQQGLVCLHICWNTRADPKVGQAVSCPPISAVPHTLLIYVSIRGPENGFALIQLPSFGWSPWWLLNQSWKSILLSYCHKLSSCNNTRVLPQFLWVRSLGLTESSAQRLTGCSQGVDWGWGLILRLNWGRICFHGCVVVGRIQFLMGCQTERLRFFASC